MNQVVRFTASGEQWLARIEDVVAVRSVDEIRRLPDPADGVLGLVDHDGEATTVLRALGDDGRHVLLVRTGLDVVGVVVEQALGVATVDDADLRGAPSGQRRPLVAGITGNGADLTFVLDPSELLSQLAIPEEMVP